MTNMQINFTDLGLKQSILSVLKDIGYIKPSPIQSACIPYLLSGRDVLGMAQTGSGKTAAFSLPMLNKIDPLLKSPQILVLTPTRELALQVSEAFNDFSKNMNHIRVLALYGGQRYDIQLRALRYGPQVVVGTPGRLLDHLKRGTLVFSNLTGLILDEADEMLRMGFIEDVESIMSKLPKDHQTALFSATMPDPILRITRRFMKNPQEIRIKSNLTTRPDISQSYWYVYGCKKNALMRFLEVENFDAAIIFVRTKSMTLEVNEVLEKNGYNSAPLNGDMNQILREKTLERLRNGNLDILIATDVAARGLDVERISLVINYDIPLDAESYVHRIGRTGRAGRAGRALLFVENRERRLLINIERIMKVKISEAKLPDANLLSTCRQKKFSIRIEKQLESSDLEKYCKLLERLSPTKDLDIKILAAALLKIAQGERPLILPPDSLYFQRRERKTNYDFRKNQRKMDIYRIEIGRNDGVEVRHIVGAITNEADMNNRSIGNIKLFNTHSTIELPQGKSNNILKNFARIRIFNKPINIKLLSESKIQDSNLKNFKNRVYNRRIFEKNKIKRSNHEYNNRNNNFKNIKIN
ncbi:DEAD/DEAH box helicase [Candidatus Tachikawaea gelatinosa]|uniref:ATP-dependent RNA helicase DeaD n=1 Tax=Candidatus Tachikawaea gelatinosa TaxID=1410383 RepID=A0A090AQ29_9ENTR|nr:DEAD/DEAH box helicase [Candidatus Tachikawaea gelatinosa]BAP58432.1 DEAD/DEAH box helicase domain protein [Candidatus Tachikawaea gelatinosa]